MRQKKYILNLLLATALFGTSSAMAADGAELYVSKGCVACHGAEGKAPIMPSYPKVDGQAVEYSLAQMKDIKSGARSNGPSAAMKGIVAGVSDEDLEAIAKYLADL